MDTRISALLVTAGIMMSLIAFAGAIYFPGIWRPMMLVLAVLFSVNTLYIAYLRANQLVNQRTGQRVLTLDPVDCPDVTREESDGTFHNAFDLPVGPKTERAQRSTPSSYSLGNREITDETTDEQFEEILLQAGRKPSDD